MSKRVLVACEYSGTVRDAFARKGFDAWSCDLLPSDIGGQHLECDVFEIINDNWDLMVAHPPCTYLTVSANKWLKDQPERSSGALVGLARRQAVQEAKEFFMKFVNCKIPRWCIENPIGVMSTEYRKPTQVIQPWMYGHGETKATCLWLRRLPRLNGFNVVEGREQRVFKMSPGEDRWKQRSTTFQGIADAMAEQWGPLLK